MWKLGGDGNQIEMNVSSSDAVDPSSDSVSESCDDCVATESCSEGCDIASFRVQERWQVSAACIVSLSFVPGKFRKKDAVKDKGKLY